MERLTSGRLSESIRNAESSGCTCGCFLLTLGRCTNLENYTGLVGSVGPSMSPSSGNLFALSFGILNLLKIKSPHPVGAIVRTELFCKVCGAMGS